MVQNCPNDQAYDRCQTNIVNKGNIVFSLYKLDFLVFYGFTVLFTRQYECLCNIIGWPKDNYE